MPTPFDPSQATFTLSNGQTMSASQYQQLYPGLYSKWVQNYAQPQAGLTQTQTSTQATAAGIPGTVAESGIKQTQQQQVNAPMQLSKDLASKMTLPQALKKYTALNMKPDDIFQKYLAESPWGMPNQNPQELQQMGVTPQALGQIGVPGSFMDKYNTRNAISGLRSLEDQWKQTDLASKLPFISNFDQNAKAYHAAREVFGEHLSSLIPGASGAQTSVMNLLGQLPDVGDITQMQSGAGLQQFKSIEDQLLKTKGYDPTALGLTPRPSDQTQKKDGGNILTSLLGDVVNPGINAINKTQQENNQGPSTKGDLMKSILKAGMQTGNEIKNVAATAPSSFMTALGLESPRLIGSGLGVLSDALGIGGKGGVDATLENAPGAVKQLLQPNKAKAVIGAIRDNLISQADKSGATINGNDLASGIRAWADKAKLSNLPDADAIEEAATNAEKLYKDQTFKPSDIKTIYDNIEKGYTGTGQPRSATASYIDRGIKGIISDTLEGAAPGFKKTSELFAKTFQAEKSPVRAGIKNMAKYGLALGVPTAAADTIAHYLFGK